MVGDNSAAAMLPTPSTSHISPSVYDPAEDSFLLLDTLSSPTETAFLATRFAAPPAPLVVELGPGSGVVIAFLAAHARHILGSPAALFAAVDLNPAACVDTGATVRGALAEARAAGQSNGAAWVGGAWLAAVNGDLATPLRDGQVDVLVFNPPYVPTPALPVPAGEGASAYERESRMLELSYAGGRDGMEVTDRLLGELPEILSSRGVAYVLLCAQNRPEEVKERIRRWGGGWRAETVGRSGKVGGWEKLCVLRIWREYV
jgi:release factor glutamine methyltransferase